MNGHVTLPQSARPFISRLLILLFSIGAFQGHGNVLAQTSVTNLGLALNNDPDIDGNLVVFNVRESSQGQTDLNGDGDSFQDNVLHVFDASTSTTTNLGLAIFDSPKIGGNLAVFRVDEFRQGLTDLNGDGDHFDKVIHTFDASTGTITNLLLSGFLVGADGGFGVFTSTEPSQPGVHIIDGSTGTVTNVGPSTGKIGGDLVVLNVFEAGTGTDLNGDGDAVDTVIHVFDVNTFTTTNLGLAGSLQTSDGNLAAFVVSEFGQGGTDLNGDGDSSDNVVHVFDASTGITINLGLALGFSSVEVGGTLVAFGVGESSQGGSDLNGDGDASDTVMHIFNASTGTTTNTGLSGGIAAVDGNLVGFAVFEFGQGGTDLNGDGDSSDGVLHIFDESAGTTTNTSLSIAGSPSLDGDLAGFLVSESDQGGTDLNGDGDSSDNVVHIFDASTGTTTNLGLAVRPSSGSTTVIVDGNLAVFGVDESDQGATDLNGDGDAFDDVLHIATIAVTGGSTPPGTDVVVEPVDETTGETPVTIAFDDVTAGGTTTVTSSSPGALPEDPDAQNPPQFFKFGSPPVVFEITTTALFTGAIEICFDYSGLGFTSDKNLKVSHRVDGSWQQITTTFHDQENDIICAEVDSLSIFAVFEAEDTDNDGLFDVDEDFLAEGTGCPNPLVADSDGDTLPDGQEVLVLGTDPCNPDSDGDGVRDDIDPFPTEPGVSGGGLEDFTRELSVDIQALDPGLFNGPNNNANRGRRNSLASRVRNAANAIAQDDIASAIDLLLGVLAKIDSLEPPPDWMDDSTAKSELFGQVNLRLALLFLL